jgi:hypothetical protein
MLIYTNIRYEIEISGSFQKTNETLRIMTKVEMFTCTHKEALQDLKKRWIGKSYVHTDKIYSY